MTKRLKIRDIVRPAFYERYDVIDVELNRAQTSDAAVIEPFAESSPLDFGPRAFGFRAPSSRSMVQSAKLIWVLTSTLPDSFKILLASTFRIASYAVQFIGTNARPVLLSPSQVALLISDLIFFLPSDDAANQSGSVISIVAPASTLRLTEASGLRVLWPNRKRLATIVALFNRRHYRLSIRGIL
jgi:hypothetical protein